MCSVYGLEDNIWTRSSDQSGNWSDTQGQEKCETDFSTIIRATTSLCFAWLEKCVSPGQWNRATTDLKAN